MRLKSLELQGFKSFPDRTVLDFTQGATIVVGPNGSGKSNISDAIRWVLGETSAKGVRGTKMEDVIFGGSDTRRQMGTAEVSLILDNTGSEGSRIADHGDEIVVTRRCVRGGDSEYMIDRKPVRLRDITELFMNTGLGRSGYSIIGQGRIAEIVSQRSEDRRSIFEEAAGISKYRVRKSEAERKIDTVSDNMVRVADILGELESRVGPLERDSEKAKKYLELYEEKKRVDVSLWLYDVEKVRNDVTELYAQKALEKRKLDEADDEIGALDRKNDRLYEESQKNKVESERISKKIRDNSDRKFALDGNIRVTEKEIEHLKERRRNAEAELEIHRAALSDGKEENERLNEVVCEQRERLSVLQREYESINANIEKLREERQKIESDMTVLDRVVQEKRDKIVEDRVRLSEISGSRESMELRRLSLCSDIEEIENQRKMLLERIEKADKSVSEYTGQYDDIKKQYDSVLLEIEHLNGEIELLHNEKNSLVPDLTSKKQRAETLRRMEEHFEGYNNSVRFVMDASDKGMLKGVLGPVSRMITSEARYSLAIETALGANIQNIVVENETVAKAAIEMLKKSGAGRATFYPVTSIRAQQLNIDRNEMREYRGYIGVASELIDIDTRCKNVIDYMLGRTLVFDSLSNATDYSRATGYRVRAVTLDGQLINAGGSFTGGSAKRDSGMLTRAQEISKLETEVEKIDSLLAVKDKKIEEKNAAVSEKRDFVNEISQKINIFETLLNAEKTQKLILQSQYENDEKTYLKLKSDIKTLETESDRDNGEREALSEELEILGEDIDKTEKERKAIEETLLVKNKEIVKMSENASTQLIKITACEKDIEATEKNLLQSSSATDVLMDKIRRDEEMIADAETSESEYNRSRLDMISEISLLEGEYKELELEQSKNTESGLQFESEMTKLRDESKEKQRSREVIFRAFTQLESKYNQIQSEQDKLTNKLWEDYELTYATASALEYPAVTAETRSKTAFYQVELKNKIKSLGSVNISAIDEYAEVKERADFMREQYDDLVRSKDDLEKIISELEKEMCARFVEVMRLLDLNFKTTFRELFGGGSAELKLSDPENPLTSGIDINVAPPGKIIKSMSLLSGGEQSFVAIALFFAILNVNPTPFAVLDEIEAALDDVNIARFANYIKRYSGETQFIIITHRRGTMEIADMLYGVTMPERGVSRVLTLNIADVESRLGVKIN